MKQKRDLFKCIIILCCLCFFVSQPVKSFASCQQEYKIIYLTFDDGPSDYTSGLLDILAKYNMKATFFLLEPEMKRNPEMVKRILDEGHSIGLHGVSHEKNLFYCGQDGPLKEMEQVNMTLESIIGQKTYLIRTPYGSKPYLTKAQQERLNAKHYILWDWNVDSRDWCYRNPYKTFEATVKMVKSCEKEPKVILFHDIKHVTETMDLFLKWMQENNYASLGLTDELEPVRLQWKK